MMKQSQTKMRFCGLTRKHVDRRRRFIFEVSESDGYALEEALRVKEKLARSDCLLNGSQRVKSVIKMHSRGRRSSDSCVGDNLGIFRPTPLRVLASHPRREG